MTARRTRRPARHAATLTFRTEHDLQAQITQDAIATGWRAIHLPDVKNNAWHLDGQTIGYPDLTLFHEHGALLFLECKVKEPIKLAQVEYQAWLRAAGHLAYFVYPADYPAVVTLLTHPLQHEETPAMPTQRYPKPRCAFDALTPRDLATQIAETLAAIHAQPQLLRVDGRFCGLPLAIIFSPVHDLLRGKLEHECYIVLAEAAGKILAREQVIALLRALGYQPYSAKLVCGECGWGMRCVRLPVAVEVAG